MEALCCPAIPAIPLPTRRPLLQRLWLDLQHLRQCWREHAEVQQQLRALRGLSDSTLRDIGMAERMPVQSATLSLADYERGRW
jgi:uncharacterized protein YjiS (DUF1127 family)